MPSTVAVVGVGNLGLAIAERVLNAGFPLIACDREPVRLETLGRNGARTTNAVADCADADICLIVVATSGQLLAVVADIAQTPASRRLRYVAVMSTVPVDVVKEVHARMALVGVHVLDAPVSGGARRAETGALTIMVGGNEEHRAALRPVFEALASNVFHCGDVGAAQAVKVMNNVVCHANIALTAEVLRLARAHGLEAERLLPVMEASSGRNWLTPGLSEARDQFWTIGIDSSTSAGILNIMRKDLDIAMEMMATDRGSYPAMAGLAEIFAGLGHETFRNWHEAGDRQ